MRGRVLFLFAGIFVTSILFSAVPGVINYQGYITDSDGEPLNGGGTITFTIYDAAVGGATL